MADSTRIGKAQQLASQDARALRPGAPDGRPRTRHVAIGDAQAPLLTFLAILDRHGLLGDQGRLRPDVHLVSIGDHFDYGPPAWRAKATSDALALLAWLAAHPADQTTIILGNHDVVRVDSLSGFDQPGYEQARAEADAAYNLGQTVEHLQAAFVERWPQCPDAEILARDYSAFSVGQRELVTTLLRERRACLAYAHDERLLLVHAGVTRADLAQLQSPDSTAGAAAAGLNGFLFDAVSRWKSGPLDLAPLHRPGSAAAGGARGALSHRPANPGVCKPDEFAGPPRRRFDPRELPAGFTQVIGHIRDGKCRALLGDWVDTATPEADGPLRSLRVDGGSVRYASGVTAGATVIFLDGGMNYTPVDRYQLLDLDRRAPLDG